MLIKVQCGCCHLIFYLFYYLLYTFFSGKKIRISMVLLTHFKIFHCGALSFTMIGQVINLDPAFTFLADGSLHYV